MAVATCANTRGGICAQGDNASKPAQPLVITRADVDCQEGRIICSYAPTFAPRWDDQTSIVDGSAIRV